MELSSAISIQWRRQTSLQETSLGIAPRDAPSLARRPCFRSCLGGPSCQYMGASPRASARHRLCAWADHISQCNVVQLRRQLQRGRNLLDEGG